MDKIWEIVLTAFIGAILALIGNKVLYRSNKYDDKLDESHENRHKKIEDDIENLKTRVSTLDKDKAGWDSIDQKLELAERRTSEKFQEIDRKLDLILGKLIP